MMACATRKRALARAGAHRQQADRIEHRATGRASVRVSGVMASGLRGQTQTIAYDRQTRTCGIYVEPLRGAADPM